MTAGDSSFLLLSTCLVFIMIPGLGYFYSGLTGSKSSLSVLLLCFLSFSVVSMQWFVIGYSLVFSTDSTNGFIGTFTNAGSSNLNSQTPGPTSTALWPDYAFAIYQSTFAAITPALIVGAGAERTRLMPKIVFILLWTTIVYDPIAYWCWNTNGWLHVKGVLDFAGGSAVHISSGFAALAVVLITNRKMKTRPKKEEANSPANVLLGTMLLWFGWNGFNGGSALAANGRAAAAIIATNMCAASSALTWTVWTYLKTKKISAIAFCSGAVTGLVIITPAAGFVGPPFAVLMGVLGTSVCYGAVRVKDMLKINDSLDVFSIHGIGGVMGNIMTGLFTQRYWANLDGTQIIYSGLIEGEWLVGWQILSCIVTAGWSFVLTGFILLCLDQLPGLALNFKKFNEELGLDEQEMGEATYDYVKLLNKPKAVTKEMGTWTGHRRPSFFRRGSTDSENE